MNSNNSNCPGKRRLLQVRKRNRHWRPSAKLLVAFDTPKCSMRFQSIRNGREYYIVELTFATQNELNIFRFGRNKSYDQKLNPLKLPI
jgi:hypothetical protein